jgi:hypothetical protein
MSEAALPADTDERAQRLLVNRWRHMSVAARACQFAQLCADVDTLARAGIAARHPGLDGAAVNHELARRRFGTELADAAYDVRGEGR